MKDTVKNNTLLAEFLGLQTGAKLGYDRFLSNWFDTSCLINGQRNKVLLFDVDWNWLMPVVEKIENYNHGCTLVIIEDERCHIYTQNGFEINSVAHSKIQSVFNACIKFIKWYNQNKK